MAIEIVDLPIKHCDSAFHVAQPPKNIPGPGRKYVIAIQAKTGFPQHPKGWNSAK